MMAGISCTYALLTLSLALALLPFPAAAELENCQLTQFNFAILPSAGFPYNVPDPFPASGYGYVNAFEVSPGVYQPVCGSIQMTSFSWDQTFFPLVNADVESDPYPDPSDVLQTFYLAPPQYVDSYPLSNLIYFAGTGGMQLFDTNGIGFTSKDNSIILNFYGLGFDNATGTYPSVTFGVSATYADYDRTVEHNQIGTFATVLVEKSLAPASCLPRYYRTFKLKVSTDTSRRSSHGEGEGEGEFGSSLTPPYYVNANIHVHAVPLLPLGNGEQRYQIACGVLKVFDYIADANIGTAAIPFNPSQKHFEVLNPPGLFEGYQSNNVLTVPTEGRKQVDTTVLVSSTPPPQGTLVDYFGIYFRSTDDSANANLYYQFAEGTQFYVDPFTPLGLSEGVRVGYYLNLEYHNSTFGFSFNPTGELAPDTPVDANLVSRNDY